MADLDNVIEQYGKDDFESSLIEVLEEDPSALPLQGFCEGGFPDEEDIQCSIVSTKEDDRHVTVRISQS